MFEEGVKEALNDLEMEICSRKPDADDIEPAKILKNEICSMKLEVWLRLPISSLKNEL
jgi:hypothetical protein